MNDLENVKQFTTNTFRAEYCTTVRPVVKTRTVMLNSASGFNRVYQLKIVDLPPVSSFPQNSLEEWSGGVSLRTASAYLLVYDASNLDTFHQLKLLKEQIYDSRDMNKVPVLIVANKYDALNPTAATSTQESRERRDICSIVRKQWKLAHLECSAKYNWRIISLFKEITRLCEILELAHAKDNLHTSHLEGFHPLNGEKCAIS
ncbi:ras-like protein family member 10B isoform X2 [Folsomia candida]|uniref:ras-like protein family member 10B isoform X2 n=1 Tax=Folsomia candida TaxID=158441 RepID=UPI001604F885|nr:ras-like protein family member 10B isoform X2 [Folsomia candida]